ncbi:hypothetical protein V4Y02_23710, partial [Escherichia coli]
SCEFVFYVKASAMNILMGEEEILYFLPYVEKNMNQLTQDHPLSVIMPVKYLGHYWRTHLETQK